MIDRQLAVKVFIRDGWKCRYCGWQNGIDPHHIIFSSHGGKDSMMNLVSLCRSCHRGVHDGKLKIVGTDANKELRFEKLDKNWKPQ
jgi:5-methylcytosine-specific restriction endonuclease McrA